MPPRVSILLPIYHGEKTLQNTLDSLLAQTYQDFEIVACIDGSQDSSEEILKKQEDSRIKILVNDENMGLGRTMNKLVYHTDSQSEFLAVAEQDDWYYPYRLEKQVQVFDNDADIGMVSGIAEHFDGEKVTMDFPAMLHGEGQFPRDKTEMFRLNYFEQIKVVNTCLMVRKSVHVDNGLYFSQHYPNIPIDWQYVLRFSLLSVIHGINKPLVRFDKRKERESVTTKRKIMNRAARELIRNCYWEYRDLLSKSDYKKALNTQVFLEGRQGSIVIFFMRLIEGFLNNPADPRIFSYFGHLWKRVKLKLSK